MAPRRKQKRKQKAGFLPFLLPIAQAILGGVGIAAAVKGLGGGLKRPKRRKRVKRKTKRRKK